VPSVRFAPGVTYAIGQAGVRREKMLRMLAAVHHHLGQDPSAYLADRATDYPGCFRFGWVIVESSAVHQFTFYVNDSDAENLFVMGIGHRVKSL
jgi:hypothetical protein